MWYLLPWKTSHLTRKRDTMTIIYQGRRGTIPDDELSPQALEFAEWFINQAYWSRLMNRIKNKSPQEMQKIVSLALAEKENMNEKTASEWVAKIFDRYKQEMES